MVYKVKNTYKEAHIMDLNMMNIAEYKKMRFSVTEILFSALPFIAVGVIAIAFALPEVGIFAECQNVAGGDICHFRLK